MYPRKEKEMPKIIENAHDLIITEAKRQIKENGYDAVTIRGIAKGCGIGLGTFYNYFKSKEMLIATFLLEDWQQRISNINDFSVSVDDMLILCEKIHSELMGFIKSYNDIFTSTSAIRVFNLSMSSYHKMLRAQMAEPLQATAERIGIENSEFLAQFVAESMIVWTVSGKSFEELSPILIKLFKN